ncbi:MAG: pyruvate kinase [Thermoprotei archaeon]|nr:pyruvate kinase [Thermoprotei archaeon]
MRRVVKIIATLGPSSSSPEVVTSMVRAGADAFRVNMSHGDVSSWDSLIASVAKVEESLGFHLGLMADLEGARIRLGDFKPLRVSPGSIVVFSFSKLGDDGVIVPHKEFFEAIEEGDMILVDDGKVSLIVESVEGFTAKLKVVEGEVIEPRKGVVVSGKEIEGPLVTSKDKACLEYIARRPFSHVMVSYARSPEHVEVVKAILRDYGRPDIKVLAKIETPAGVMKVRDIAQASDGIIVARGDLGMHFKLEDIPIIQKDIVAAARAQYKPVILATEFLSSMIESPVPSRSEIVDIYEAVRLSADALLLTGETAIGRNPVKTVQWMAKVIAKAQQGHAPERPPATAQIYRLVRGLVELIENLNATLVVYSRTGRFAERLAAFRPTRTIYVGVPNEKIERTVRTLWAAEPVVVGDMPYEEGLKKTTAKLEEEGVIGVGDVIVEAAWSSERGVYLVRVRNIIAP